MTLAESTDPQFQHLLGKRIEIIHKGQRYTGCLEFAGINNLLHNQFQVTIDRLPLWPVDPKDLKLIED